MEHFDMGILKQKLGYQNKVGEPYKRFRSKLFRVNIREKAFYPCKNIWIT